MSIRAKFLVLLTLVLVIGVGTTGGVLIFQSARHDQKLIAEKQRLLVEHAAFAMQENLSVAARELSRIAGLPEMDPDDSDTDPERQLLYGAHENSVFFKTIRLLDVNGRVTLVQPAGSDRRGQDYSDRGWFDAARRMHQPFFYTLPEHSPAPEGIGLVVPLRRDAGFVGAIQGVLDLQGDHSMSSELSHTAGPDGEVTIVDREGRVVYPPGRSDLADHGWGPALREVDKGHAGSLRLRDVSGDFLYAWAPVGLGGWGVMMRWPWRALAGGVREQITSIAAILGIGVLLVALVALLFAARLTRPLVALSEVAARLARGEPGGVARSSRRDEVGALANAFHHMETELARQSARIREDLETISALNASLEQRVHERTAALEAAQARLLEVERFAAMGKTAAAIAHEVRNALNGLGMCVDLVLADTESTAASMRVRAQIHHELARLRDITESLLTFSRTPRLERASVDLNALVSRALAVCDEQMIDGGVTLRLDMEGGEAPLTVECDGYKLQGVLINLVKNAIEAMSTRPLDLAASSTEPAPRDRILVVRTRRVPGHGDARAELAVEVHDTGPGLRPEARDHLFEPFHTTKVTGTGLGLATARRIVEAHGGRITVEDAAGAEGTVAIVYLPDHAAHAAAHKRSA